MLSQQIEQRRFDPGNDVFHPQVDLVRLPEQGRLRRRRYLMLLAAGVLVGDRLANAVERAVEAADGRTHHQRHGLFQRAQDAGAARYLAHADMAGAVFQHDQVARKERRMCAAQVEQHAVMAGDRDYLHFRHNRTGVDGRLRHVAAPVKTAAATPATLAFVACTIYLS